jgi:hypothetical protein
MATAAIGRCDAERIRDEELDWFKFAFIPPHGYIYIA